MNVADPITASNTAIGRTALMSVALVPGSIILVAPRGS
jgi:hypothetical protein